MKRLICLVLLLCASATSWSAVKKINVAGLEEMLKTMHRDNKSDADVALALKQVQLTERLSRPVMNSLSEFVPGQQTTEQMYVLEARSAMLAPPAADQPATPALDVAAQQALLAKAAAYASTTYQQLPSLTATRTTLRFQDNVEALAQSTGQAGSAKEMSGASMGVSPFNFVRYIEANDMSIGMEHGVERLPVDKNRWGPNKRIQLMEPYPGLAEVFQQATDAAAIKWSRWELVNGKPAAVFAYQVPKKKAHVAVTVCCFPELDQAGIANFSNGSGISGGRGGGNASGNFQTNTDWKAYKQKDLPYHGEFFIDPDTGVVVRLITQMEPKPTDVVHQADIRTDYGQVDLGGKSLILPVRAFVVTEIVVNGEAGAGGYAERCTLFTSDYKNYQLAAK